MEKFFMVFKEGGNSPTYKHESFQLAQAEAKRLIGKCGGKFYVLAATYSIEETPKFLEKSLSIPELDETIPF